MSEGTTLSDAVAQAFLTILAMISDAITALLGMLPNPDPFPEILDQLEMQQAGSDVLAVAWYWLDSFFVGDAVISVLGTWFVMFPIAWIIMMGWKWLKAR